MSKKNISTRSMASINHTDEDSVLKMGNKRDLSAMETSFEKLSPRNSKKRQKLSNNNEKACSNEIHKNGKVSKIRNELTDTVKNRTYCRKKLTTENLKTILRYVLANNSVLTMVQNTMKLQKENKSLVEIEGQPEMTKTATKESVKALLAILTPRKCDDVAKKLLEEEYSEESASDEDYQPNEEEFSDEDAAWSTKTDDLNSSMADNTILSDLKSPNQLSDGEDALVIALPETDGCHDKEVDKIAQRTRSKVCLNDTPLEAIESTFQPPDITMDMYDTPCADADWTEFICEFTKPLTSGVGSVADDTEDEKDPEYKVQEEEEEEDEDEFDYDEILGENPLEVPGDEVKDLMTEILEFAQQDKSLLEEDFSFLEELNLTFSGNDPYVNDSNSQEIKNVSEGKENKKNSNVQPCNNDLETDITAKDSDGKKNEGRSHETEIKATDSHSKKTLNSTEDTPNLVQVENVRKEWMIPDERCQLDEQMRMYVQILTQSYLLSFGFPNLNFINASSMESLKEIKSLASKGSHNNQRSAFYAYNLDEAISIVDKFESLGEPKEGKPKKLNKSIPHNVKQVLASSKAFIYPELLPKNAFYTFFLGSKAYFSIAEDNLVALGLEQFSEMENTVETIQKLLLPTKSVHQIKCHIKNSKLKKELNPITYFCKHKKLPEILRVIRVFDPNNVKAPEDYPPSALPAWMEPYSNLYPGNKIKNQPFEKPDSSKGNKPKLILPRIQIVPTFIQEVQPPDPQGAPQPVICRVYSLNENNLSKGGLMLPKRINRRKKRLAKNQVNKSTQFPDSSDISIDSGISQIIKQEPLSEETSDEEGADNEYNSDSHSEGFLNLHTSVHKENFSLRTMVTRSMSTIHETSQTDSPCSDSIQSILTVTIKEEPLLNESFDDPSVENNSVTQATHSKTRKSRSLATLRAKKLNQIEVNHSSLTEPRKSKTRKSRSLAASSVKKLNQIEVNYSTLTEPSLRIVTSQGDESTDSEKSIPECNELLTPIQKFPGSIIEDAVLPPASNNNERHLPSDFSTIREIICSEEERKKLLASDKTKRQPKKSSKAKKNWSMEEDQLIISNCQRYGINKRAFRASADEIGELTPLKIKQRFIYLLKLLSEKLKTKKQ